MIIHHLDNQTVTRLSAFVNVTLSNGPRRFDPRPHSLAITLSMKLIVLKFSLVEDVYAFFADSNHLSCYFRRRLLS